MDSDEDHNTESLGKDTEEFIDADADTDDVEAVTDTVNQSTFFSPSFREITLVFPAPHAC